MDDFEIRYTTGELADQLKVEPVTVRKYSVALERAGYVIDRNDGKNRSFSERDVMAFKFMQTLRQKTGITLEAAADLTVRRGKADTAPVVHDERSEGEALSERHDDRYEVLSLQMNQLKEILLSRLDDQQLYIEESLEKRDAHLMEVLRELQENRQAIVAAAESEAKRPWWRLWR